MRPVLFRCGAIPAGHVQPWKDSRDGSVPTLCASGGEVLQDPDARGVGHGKMSTRRHTPGVWSSAPPLSASGERLCRNCHGPMPKDRRKHNCSRRCSEEWRCKTSLSHLRFRLEERDHGICAQCGLDTVALKAEFREFCRIIQRSWVELRTKPMPPGAQLIGNEFGMRSWSERDSWLKEHGIPTGRHCSDWWDADHIVPVIDGGGECGLDNYRTLCIPCHKRETAALRKRMAQRRVEAKALPLLEVARQ